MMKAKATKNNSIIKRIMDIDKKIRGIKTDLTYLKLKKNLIKLKNPPYFNRTLKIASPYNISKTIEITKRSKDVDPLKKKFESRLEKYDKRIKSLYKKKEKLKKQVFA